MDDYRPFLEDLKRHKWEDLGKVLVFPIYGFAYNWTMSCDVNGILLAKRIKAIMKEAASVIGVCKKVILLTHSMGGLVARSAMLTHGAKDDVLGVVHGVHPANGAPAAYWRIKAGFEGTAAPSAVLGDSGPHVAALLANSPGGLELLPNKRYTASTGKGWLAVRNPDGTVSRLPKNDPYEEIYKVPASLDPTQAIGQSNNKYWGLVEPRLLDPGNQLPADLTSISSKEDRLDALASSPTWSAFCKRVDNASQFHESIGSEIHAVTFCVVGTGHTTTETIGFLAEEFSPIEHDDIYRNAALAYRGGPYHPDPKSSKVYHYPVRGFRGAMRSAAGKNLVAVLKGPSGNGDGTVPQTSADATLDTGAAKPGNLHLKVEHQPAYENDEVQKFVIKAINAMCVKYLS